jgi:Cu/Ag efflux protein CusF
MVCFAAGMLYAAEAAPALTAAGSVKSVDAEGGKVVVAVKAAGAEEATDMTFLVTEDTKIRAGRDTKTIKDLAAGTRVTVVYKKGTDDAGTLTAVQIYIMTEEK